MTYIPDMTVPGSLCATQARITALAVQSIPGCECADLMMLDTSQRLQTVASTDPVASMAGVLQRHNGSGPSVTALATGSCCVSDLATNHRWPQLTAWAFTHGLASICVLRLSADSGTLGVLNLYSRRPRSFLTALEEQRKAFAADAVVALEIVRRDMALSDALPVRQRSLV